MVLERLTTLQMPGPAWKQNSCHLDSFFLSELAFYTTSDGVNIIDDPAQLPRAVQRILRVLLTLGLNGDCILNQNSVRDDYRTYELSRLPVNARRMREANHGKADYTTHGDMLTSLAYEEQAATYIQDERMLGSCMDIRCSGLCRHREGHATSSTMVFRTYVHAPTHWYATTDGTALHELTATQYASGGAAVTHSTLHDVVLSHLARPVGDRPACDDAQCASVSQYAVLSWTKHPRGTRFPRSLELDRSNSKETAPTAIEFSLTFGDVKYQLISIILQNEGHYRAVVLLGTDWWEYDDLRRDQGLLKIGGKTDLKNFLAKLRASRKNVLYPRVWRYTRVGVQTFTPHWVEKVDLKEFSTLCFNDPSVHETTIQSLREK